MDNESKYTEYSKSEQAPAPARNIGTIRKMIVAAMSVFLVLLIVALIVNLVRLGAANSRKSALAEQNAKLEQLIEDQDQMIYYYGTSEFVEEYAREMLDMIYRGETVIGRK